MNGQKMLLRYSSPAPKYGENTELYPSPESVWEKWSLPIANGFFGASIFGHTDTERLQITENSLANPWKSLPNGARYGLSNFAELYFEFGHTGTTSYERTLSLDDAVSTVKYTYNGVIYEREYFASYPNRVIAMRFSANKKGKISFCAHPEIPFVADYCVEEGDGCGKHGEVTAKGDTLTVSGVMDYYDIKFEGQLKIINNGGTLRTENDRIYVENADEAILLFACGTNYKMESRVFLENDPKKKLAPYPHPHDAVTKFIENASKKTYSELKSIHIADYSALFGRVLVDVGGKDTGKTTDELLSDYKSGNESRHLETLLYQYGRYLLIASSRPGGMPSTLQGIWNAYRSSPWSCGYWHNINIQMNYWPACISNLAETFLPYVEYNKAYTPQTKAHADRFVRNNYPENLSPDGENGWIIGTGAWPYSVSGFDSVGHSGPGTGAFTSLLFWDYYDYTRDEDFLKNVCYPILRGMSVFLSKSLKEIDGSYLIEHSASPEMFHNGVYHHTVGCAFDQQMVYENFKRTLDCAEILGINEPLLDQIREMLPKLDPVIVGESGQVKEYREEKKYGDIGDEYHHRHISQLVGMYPGTIINSSTPEWIKAASVTLTERGDKSTGWAAAHRLCLWTRTGNGKKSMDLIRSMLKNNILPNLWDTHPPFQIDGNFGYTAGMSEMLMQSQAGYIELLRSLPREWSEGEFKGLIARGNFSVDCKWSNMTPTYVKILSRAGESLSVAIDISHYKFTLNGTIIAPPIGKNGIPTLKTKRGDVLEIEKI